MAYGVVNRSGCTERYGLVQVRLDLCLEAGDVRWNDPRFYQVDQTSKAFLRGFKGKLDDLGSPVDVEAYAAWRASLPKAWLPERCFHSHFIYLDPYTLRDEQITDAMALHLPNFYKAWTDEWDKVAGGMRHGWDVATRKRPERFDKTQPEVYEARKAQCLTKLDTLKASSLVARAVGEGKTFPSTDIDVGAAATHRGSTLGYGYTYISLDNAANDTGSLDTIEIYAYSNMNNGCIAATFYLYSGTTYITRDSQALGNITAGAARTISGLDISVSAGDFIGCYFPMSGIIREDDTGYAGVMYYATNRTTPGNSASYTLLAGDALSLYGTGETAVSAIVEVGDEAEDIGDEMLRRGRMVLMGDEAEDIGDEMLRRGRMVLMGSGVRGHP